MSRSATSTHFFNTSRDGDSTTSLGSLLQCLTTLSVYKFFVISNLNLPWRNLRPYQSPAPLQSCLAQQRAPQSQLPLLGSCPVCMEVPGAQGWSCSGRPSVFSALWLVQWDRPGPSATAQPNQANLYCLNLYLSVWSWTTNLTQHM